MPRQRKPQNPDTLGREYLRVSRDASGHLRSPDEQHGDHDRDATDRGWTLGTPYAEKKAVGASRYSKGTRGDFGQLLDDLEHDRFGAQILLLWESSRGSRRVSEWVTLLELCEQRRVQIWVHTDHRLYDPRNARDRRSLLEDAVDSEYETAKSSDRIRRSVRSRANAGRPHGRRLYGYRREYEITNSGVRQLIAQVPDEATAPIVKEIFERVANREGPHVIATSLTKRGVATPRTAAVWRATSVHQIVRNRAYLGQRWHRGQMTKAEAWEPLVDRDLFDRANGYLSRPGAAPRTDAVVKHLLSGLAECGKCGGAMRWSGGGKKNNPMYYCSDRYCVGRDQVALEGHVIPRAVAIMAKVQDLAAGDDDADPALAEAEDELEALQGRLEAFTDAAADGRDTAEGTITPARLAKIEARLTPKIEAAERRVQALRAPRLFALRKITGPIAEVWDDLDIGTQRELIQATVAIVVHPVGMGRRNYDLAEFVDVTER